METNKGNQEKQNLEYIWYNLIYLKLLHIIYNESMFHFRFSRSKETFIFWVMSVYFNDSVQSWSLSNDDTSFQSLYGHCMHDGQQSK